MKLITLLFLAGAVALASLTFNYVCKVQGVEDKAVIKNDIVNISLHFFLKDV